MFNIFIDKLLAFPLWVKQVIFLRLYQNLSLFLSEDFITVKDADIFHLYTPVLSFTGRTELFEQKCGLDDNIYIFMKNAEEGFNMLEIAMNNFWTMEELSKYYIQCLEQNYVKTPESMVVYATVGFMSGKFKTGEYFKRVGKINVDQLEAAIVAQKKYIESGKPLKMAEVMISMGLVTEKDTLSLLSIKEEAKKRFIIDLSVVPKEVDPEVKKYYEDIIAKQKEENKVLKEKLTKILAYVKKDG